MAPHLSRSGRLFTAGVGLLLVVGTLVFSGIVDATRVQSQASVLPIPKEFVAGPISSAEEAYSLALYFDSVHAKHPKTLTSESIELPTLTTRQDFLDSRAIGAGFPDSEFANESVWVVTIKGEVSLSLPGTSPDTKYYDVTYILSAKTGELVGVTTR